MFVQLIRADLKISDAPSVDQRKLFATDIPKVSASTARPRILQVFKTITPETAGGIPTVMSTISEGLRDQFDFSFLVSSNKGAEFFENHLGVPVKTVRNFGHSMSMPIAPTFPWRLRALEKHYDLIVLHAPFPLADMAGYLGAFCRTPLIVHWHADIVRQVKLKSLYISPMRQSLQRAHAVIVAGEKLIEPSEILREFDKKCHVIPFGVDVDYWKDLSADDREAVHAMRLRNPRLVLAVGRLVSYKGFSTLIEAMNRVDGELWIVGKGPLERTLQRQIDASSGTAKVRLLGEVSQTQLRRLYHAAQLLCLPSISNAEAFGIVQLEAMSAGVPVINTSLNTMVPLVARQMQEGLTVVPGDAASLASAISCLLSDDPLRNRLGRASRERAVSEFSESAFLRRVALVYENVIRGLT